MTWRPIETAPEREELVLLASNRGHVTAGRWNRHVRGYTTDVGTFHAGTTVGGEPCFMTHWMPLPAPPQ